MKNKLVFFIAILLLITLTAKAQNKAIPNNLKGVWQLCELKQTSEDGFSSDFSLVRLLPSYKILSESGELTNLSVHEVKVENVTNLYTIISCAGSYKQLSDSVYNEIIKTNLNWTLDGKTVELKYKIVDNKFLFTSFFIEKNDSGNDINQIFHETWIKVEFPDISHIRRKTQEK